jgi:hypothetical protein
MLGAASMSRRTWKIALIILGVIVAAPFLAYGGFIVLLNGGIANTIRNLKPEPNMERASIKSARDKRSGDIESALRSIGANNDFTAFATGKDDRCYEGQNNYKVAQGYAHRCTLRLTRYYGFDGDFRQRMLDFEKSLLSSGWKNGLSDDPAARVQNMEYMMTGYYDQRPGMSVESVPAPSGYNAPGLVLELRWAGRQTKDLSSLEYTQHAPFYAGRLYQRPELVNVEDAFKRAVQGHRYVIAVAIYGHYFEN